MKVPFSYLPRQFENPDPILAKIKELVTSGALTLGKTVEAFEEAFAAFIGTRYAIGVGSGTDALFLSLKALGVGPGHEVITCANTFVATAGAIHTTGARVVFVDCNDKFVIDTEQVEAAISPRTAAIMPVHYTGQPANLPELQKIAKRHNLPIVEDACTGIDASIGDLRCGATGLLAGFSFHPLKNLNIWGDGGMITTQSEGLYRKMLLVRNHGMLDRDTYAFFSFNSRLDTIQAAVGHHLLPDVTWITNRRIEVAHKYDTAFADLAPEVRTPPRDPGERHVFHLYMMRVSRRDELLATLKAAGISAKIHYPRPLHLQPAAAPLGYQPGSMPLTELMADEVISLPCHQHLTDAEVDFVITQVRQFYGASL